MKKVFVLLCIAAAAVLMVSCSDSSESDSSSESEIVSKMLTSEQIDVLEDMDMPLYSGTNPPDITGYYYANDFDCIDSTDGASTSSSFQNLQYYFKFYDKDGTRIKLDYFNNYHSDEATGNGAYIFGEGNEFSVYMETEGGYPAYGVEYTTVNIYSGVLTDTGIEDFTMGFIMTGKENDDYDDFLMAVNEARIYREGDGCANSLHDDPGFDSSVARKVAADGEVVKNAIMSAVSR